VHRPDAGAVDGPNRPDVSGKQEPGAQAVEAVAVERRHDGVRVHLVAESERVPYLVCDHLEEVDAGEAGADAPRPRRGCVDVDVASEPALLRIEREKRVREDTVAIDRVRSNADIRIAPRRVLPVGWPWARIGPFVEVQRGVAAPEAERLLGCRAKLWRAEREPEPIEEIRKAVREHDGRAAAPGLWPSERIGTRRVGQGDRGCERGNPDEAPNEKGAPLSVEHVRGCASRVPSAAAARVRPTDAALVSSPSAFYA
jgi:hypothetical protein